MKNIGIRQRIIEYIEYKGISKYKFYQETGFSNGFLDKEGSIGSDKCEKICYQYPDVSPEWLLMGKKPMLREEEQTQLIDYKLLKEEAFKGGSPFYEDLPVSAGEVETISNNESPTGYLKIPGITPYAYFPVIGCSLKPEINPGDIIGVNLLNRWDQVDPDNIYMIITHERRMIKHLRVDNNRDDILWCVSPNYKEFSITKDEIKAIYHVVFAGRLI